MVTYGGMSKKPVTVSTSSFIFKVLLEGRGTRIAIFLCWVLHFEVAFLVAKICTILLQKEEVHEFGKIPTILVKLTSCYFWLFDAVYLKNSSSLNSIDDGEDL